MIKSLRSIIVIITLLGLHTAAAAAVDLYPRSEVARGLKGHAYTVIEGTEIESFDVEILGVLPTRDPAAISSSSKCRAMRSIEWAGSRPG